MKKLLFIIPLISIFIQGCYIGKPLKENKTIFIETSFETNVNNSFDNKYSDKGKADIYKKEFLKGLKNEGKLYNLDVYDDKLSKADYVLTIKYLSIKESSHAEVVNDEKSPHNGKSFLLSDIDVSSTFILYKGNKEKHLGEWSSSASKEEKITNNRNLGDYMFGFNKDNSEYRFKGLKDDICEDLSEKCGKHIIVKITRKISKNL